MGIINVDFFWGVEKDDKSGVTRWDSMNLGEIVWDSTFDAAPEAN